MSKQDEIKLLDIFRSITDIKDYVFIVDLGVEILISTLRNGDYIVSKNEIIKI